MALLEVVAASPDHSTPAPPERRPRPSAEFTVAAAGSWGGTAD
jgi:hypothetical protein